MKDCFKKIGELYYVTFILGYDLLQNELIESENRETDKAFDKCMKIAKEFIDSEYNTPTKGLYSCVQEFIEDKQYDDLNN